MSNDYTPTTDEVRDDYHDAVVDWPDERYEQFDRWLEQVKAEARAEGARESLTTLLTRTVPVTTDVGIFVRAVPDMEIAALLHQAGGAR